MADTKIGDLPTDVVTLADGDKFPIADASALTVDTYATALEIKTHGNTAPVFAAGTASANTHPKFTAGTLLTTAEDGAIEFDGNSFYGTSDPGNRGAIPAYHFIRQAASRTLTNVGTEQKLFDSVANGTLTLETGTYFFQCMMYITAMSATSGNLAFDILGAGTLTLADVLWHAVGVDNTTPTSAVAQNGSFSITGQGVASVVLAATGTAMGAEINGTFEVTGAGTLIPSVTLVTATSGVTVAAGTYFKCNRVGAINVVSVGDWS